MANRASDAGGRTSRRLWLLTALAALVVAGVGLAGGTWYASAEIEKRLQGVATAAGLTFVHDGISISPLGRATISGMRLTRPDGSDVMRATEIAGALAPLDALRGRRRPERMRVNGLRLHIKVVDGKPNELIRLARAARQMLGARKPTAPKQPTKQVKRGTAISLTDGEIQIDVTGRGAMLLPKGLKLSGLRVDVDTAEGRGDVAAVLSGSANAKLSARLLPATATKPAQVAARFSPQLTLALPTLPGLPRLADTIALAGFGYDAVDGPRIEGVVLRKNEKTVMKVERAGLADATTAGLGVKFGPVHVALEQAAALDALRRLQGAGRSSKTAEGENKSKGDKAPDTKALKTRKTGPMWPPADTVWQADAAAVTAHQTEDGGLLLRAVKVSATLPSDMGALGVKTIEVRAGMRGGLGAIRSVALTEPSLDLRWRESGLKQLPEGERLYWMVERLRGNGGPPTVERDDAGAKAAQDKGAQGSRLGKRGKRGKRKRRRKRRRKKGKRVPATRAAIAPLRALHTKLLSTDALATAFFTRLGKLAGAEVKIDAGRIGLLLPASTKPFAGLRGGSFTLSRRLSDGSRSVSGSVEPFIRSDGWGPVKIEVQAGPGGHLAKASLNLAGSGWAKTLSMIGKAASVREDAHLSLDLSLTAKSNKETKLSGTLKVAHVGVNWWRIAPRPIDDFSFGGTMKLAVTANPPEIQLAMTKVDLGGAKLNVTMAARDLVKRPTVQLQIEAPLQDCGEMAKAIPASLIPTIGAITAEGDLGGKFNLTIPLDNPYKGKLKASLKDEACTVTQFGELDVTALARPFKRPVNESGTILEDQLIGPRSDAWLPLAKMPPWVPYAMIATEDAAFYHHKGVRLGLTSRAIKMCLDYGRFVYGGSTITQQLVKNLFLTRDKYLGRKFEELLIVWHMERNLIDAEKVKAAKNDAQPIKDRILEIYINGIEFAPHLYGIQRGAKLYFGKNAAELTPLEAAFLAANKPCPKCGHKRFEQKKWTPWWQERMVGIMNKMRTNGIITEEQFVAEAPYVPRFVGWPQAAAPGPGGDGGDVGGAEE